MHGRCSARCSDGRGDWPAAAAELRARGGGDGAGGRGGARGACGRSGARGQGGGRRSGARAARELARAADAGAVARWLDEARALAGEGDADGALNRATLAAAVAPDEAAPVVRDARLRAKLKTIS